MGGYSLGNVRLSRKGPSNRKRAINIFHPERMCLASGNTTVTCTASKYVRTCVCIISFFNRDLLHIPVKQTVALLENIDFYLHIQHTMFNMRNVYFLPFLKTNALFLSLPVGWHLAPEISHKTICFQCHIREPKKGNKLRFAARYILHNLPINSSSPQASHVRQPCSRAKYNAL